MGHGWKIKKGAEGRKGGNRGEGDVQMSGKKSEKRLKGSEGKKYGAFDGRNEREACEEKEGDDGKTQTGDGQGECGLKEEREGGAGRISEARQKPHCWKLLHTYF